MDKKDFDATMAALEKSRIKHTASKEAARAYLEKAGLIDTDDTPVGTYEGNKKEEFPYVTARLWYPDKPVTWKNLYIYSYGTQVLYGTKADAEGFLGYVNFQSEGVGGPVDKGPNNPYKIYRLDFEEWND